MPWTSSPSTKEDEPNETTFRRHHRHRALQASGSQLGGRPHPPVRRDASELERAQQKLPPLPADIKARKRFNIAVKCDHTTVRLHRASEPRTPASTSRSPAGFRRFAFGKSNRVTWTCVSSAAREPALTTGRVDLVTATFTYNTDRETRIDFSRAYYKSTGRMLVRNDSSIRSLNDLAGKTVATTSGSVYDAVDQELLQGHEAHRHGRLLERADRVPRRARGHADVRRQLVCSGRRHRSRH